MATIRLDLTQFKASGIYTLEFDASETIVLNTQTIRLIVGFSRQGPFNAPVYCPDKKTAERVYGKIDPFLERRGSFFHRALYTALDIGPVFGLNLMPLNNDEDFGDKVPYFSYSLATTEPNGRKVWRLYASFYNKERFWYPDEEYFLGNVNAPGSINAGKLFNVVNLGQKPVSIIVKKATVQGYNLTAREWYGAGNVPTYIDEWDLIEDYFLTLIIIAGDWTNYAKLSVDPVFNKYFDIRGLKKDQLANFLGAPEVNVIGQFTGCIIPNFEQNGVNQSLEVVVNNALAGTGIFIAIDKKALENYDKSFANSDDFDITSAVDLIGHNFADPTRENPDIINFLSYKTVIKEALNFVEKTTFTEVEQLNNPGALFSTESIHLGKGYGYLDNILVIPRPDLGSQSGELTELEYLSLKNLLNPGQSLLKLHGKGPGNIDKWAIIQQVYEEEDPSTGKTSMKIIYTADGKDAEVTDPVGLPFTADATPGASNITISASELGSTALAYFEDWTNYPVIGEDILLENKTTKTWYYAKVNSSPVFTYDGTSKVSVKIPLEDTDALTTLAASSSGYRAYFKSVNRVQPYSIVFEDGYTLPNYSFIPTGIAPTGLTGFTHSLTIPAPATAGAMGATAFRSGENLPSPGDKILITLGTCGGAPDYYHFLTVSAPGPVYWATAVGGATAQSGATAAFLTIPVVYSATAPESFIFNEEFAGSSTAIGWNAYIHNTVINLISEDVTAVTKEQSNVTFVYEPDKFIFYSPTAPDNRLSTADPNRFIAYKYSKLYKYFDDGALLTGDKYYYSPTDYFYLDYEKTVDSDGIPVLEVKAYDTFVDGVLGTNPTLPITSPSAGINMLATANYLRGGTVRDPLTDGITIYVVADTLFDDIPILSWNANKTEFSIRPEWNTQIQVGQYIVAEIKDSEGQSSYKLTKVLSKKRVYNAQLDSWAYTYGLNQSAYIFEPNIPDGNYYITRYLPIDDFIKNYQLISLEGFKLTEYHLPGGNSPSAQLEKILGMLDPQNSNLIDMLKSRDVITFRYVVDTFDGGLEPMTGAKRWLTRLAQQRQKCLALVNAPPIRDFIASTDPRFTELPTKVDPKPILNTRYIADGGNLSLGPSKTFSLVDETWGSKFAGYFSPFLTIRENGKNINIPPAAHVSNLFVQKFIKGQPYHIVAGPRRGVISEPKLVGLEYDFLDKDREYLEPMGINPIIKKKGVGYMIYANQMAYQKTKSAFNNLHVRDLLITIEEAVEDILANYIFEFNDSNTRLEIKTIIDGYLEGVRSAGGIYNYSVQMDETNNPPEIIDQNMAIVDIGIEPARGIHKFINRVTVYKTGGIASGGFTFA